MKTDTPHTTSNPAQGVETPLAAKWTAKLRDVGGMDNGLVAVPADGVRAIIDDLANTERQLAAERAIKAELVAALEALLDVPYLNISEQVAVYGQARAALARAKEEGK